MNHNTNDKPGEGTEEERLALAYGRVISELDDLSPEWLGGYYIDEQRAGIEAQPRSTGSRSSCSPSGTARTAPGREPSCQP